MKIGLFNGRQNMILTLEEILHTCRNWEEFCKLHGYNEWAVNEGGADVQVSLTEQQAHHLGIVKLESWRVEDRDKVYPPTTENYDVKNEMKQRLEYLRGEIKAERISYEEIAELKSLAEYIDEGDTLLLEWAEVPEFD